MPTASEFQFEIIDLPNRAAPQIQPLIAITPTLVIGLGGPGKGVVTRLRRLFYERYGQTRFPMIGHLVIDSDDLNKLGDIGGAIGGSMHRDLQLNPSAHPPEFLNVMLG